MKGDLGKGYGKKRGKKKTFQRLEQRLSYKSVLAGKLLGLLCVCVGGGVLSWMPQRRRKGEAKD